VATTGFEKPAFKNEYGPMPHKGEVDKSGLDQQITYLKGHHFGLGKDNSTF